MIICFLTNPSLIYYLWTAVPLPPSTPPSPFPIPIIPSYTRSSPLLPLPPKEQPGIFTKHGLAEYNRAGHKPSHQDWAKQPSRRKGIPGACKRVTDTPTLTDNISPEHIFINRTSHTNAPTSFHLDASRLQTGYP